jgi:hypothetical protein
MNNAELAEALRAPRSRALLTKAGYDPGEVEDLHESGIGAVHFDEISELAAIELMGSNPPNLSSPDAAWDEYKPKESSGRVMLVDFYSGAVFRPAELKNFAMFGKSGLLPRFAPMLPLAPLNLRWRFTSVPALLAHTHEELRRAAAALQETYAGKNRIVFRGQPEQYFVPREPRTMRFLYGDSSPREPDLLSTAFRKQFPYVSTERHWRAIVADIDYRLTGYKDTRWWVEDRMENVPVGQGMVAQWHRVSTMAVGQHYGIPTYGLDVSESLDAAWWFATHRFKEEGGKAHHVPHNWNSLPLEKWPVIYVFWTGTSVGISKLELPATRPGRQRALFVQGGWGLHGNLCAEDLIAVIVLAPEVGVASGDTATLFPEPKDDPFYGELLKLKARLTSAHPLYEAAALQYVPDYTHAK